VSFAQKERQIFNNNYEDDIMKVECYQTIRDNNMNFTSENANEVKLLRIATGITSISGAKLDISLARSDLKKSVGVLVSIEFFFRSERAKMMSRFDARNGSYFGRDPYPNGKALGAWGIVSAQ
jgi:hypothetical protein